MINGKDSTLYVDKNGFYSFISENRNNYSSAPSKSSERIPLMCYKDKYRQCGENCPLANIDTNCCSLNCEKFSLIFDKIDYTEFF